MEPCFGRGYNVSSDNFFTSRDLACKLIERRTSIVGTVQLNRREIPSSTKLKLHESAFYKRGEVDNSLVSELDELDNKQSHDHSAAITNSDE